MPIDDGREVQETAAHREVGDIGAPGLIRSDDDGVPEQVGINLPVRVEACRFPVAGPIPSRAMSPIKPSVCGSRRVPADAARPSSGGSRKRGRRCTGRR